MSLPIKNRRQEFLEERIYWKWFKRRLENDLIGDDYSQEILLEILKELQYMNDRYEKK